MKEKSEFVYGCKGTKFENVRGTLTGGEHHCTLEGCRGLRLAVRWPDGHMTFPCSKGMRVRADGDYEIL